MHSVTRIRIRAPYERIFGLAAEVERWPQLLPHYRYVRPVPDPHGERRFAMGARRGRIPVSWEAVQRPLPEQRRIEFVHTGGVTRGMRVAWVFEPDGAAAGSSDVWNVAIHHDLELRWPLIGDLVARHVIGPQFIEAVAGRTLRRVKALAEAGS
ncbi:MAG TPA: SRPBCC family protein [candidate division Zixibacteria bacterium]|nr:SRPBCC family protein [candidate division Zixibacteria bacterium]